MFTCSEVLRFRNGPMNTAIAAHLFWLMDENWLGDCRGAVNLFKSRDSDKDTIQTADHFNDIASHADMLIVMFRKTSF